MYKTPILISIKKTVMKMVKQIVTFYTNLVQQTNSTEEVDNRKIFPS